MRSLPSLFRRPWIPIVVVLVLVAYTAGGFWLVPRLVSSNVRHLIATRYHREARLGEVTFNPFTWELLAKDFAIPDADGAALLSFDRLSVRVGFASVLRVAPEFKSITLEAPRVRLVRRRDGSVNLLDLVPPPDPKVKADPNAPPPRLWIDELTIRGGAATIVDLARSQPLTLALQPISFTLHDFSTRSEGNAYSLKAKSALGEGLEWHGTFGLAPVASAGAFTVTHVKATTLAQIGAEQVPFEISGGEVDLNGTYKLSEKGETLGLEAHLVELVVHALGIRARGDSADAVQIPRLAVTDTSLDLGAQTVKVGHVLIEQPRVTALRSADGTLSLMRLLPAATPPSPDAAPPATPAAPTPSAKPWVVSIPDIRVSGADLSLEDRTPASPATFHLSPVDLAVTGTTTQAGQTLSIDLAAVINGTGRASAKGTVVPSPLSAHLTVAADSLPLPVLQSYADDRTSMVIKSGTASASGTLDLDASGAIQFDGAVGIDDLATLDRQLEQDFVKWRSVAVTGMHLRTQPFGVKIREIAVHAPYARLVIGANGVTNIKQVLAPRAAAAEASAVAATQAARTEPAPTATTTSVTLPPKAPKAALPVDIGIVRIDGGSMNFADLSIKPDFDTGIQDLAGTIKGLSGRADSRADIDFAGTVDRYSPVKISGKVNFLSSISHLDLSAKFSNLELTNLSPYSGRFAGYAIERGKMNVDLNYKLEDRQLEAKHRVVINQLQLGEKVESAEATSLPVKLAIALLKDRNGVIDLDLPISGSLDDPKFQIGPLVWKVVVGLFQKAVTAPFALLGSLFGGGEEFSYVEFPAGSSAVDAVTAGKLQTLVKALEERPALNVDVPMSVQPDTDRAALVANRLHDGLVSRARARLGAHANDPGAVDRVLSTPKDYRALLEDAYREAFGHRPDVPKPATTPDAGAADVQAIAWLEGELKARISIGPDDLDDLGRARADNVQTALLTGTGIDPGRVFIVAAQPLPVAPAIRMQLALH